MAELVQIRGTFRNADGLRRGRWWARLEVPIADTADDEVTPAGLWDEGRLSLEPPSLSFYAPAVDSPDYLPQGAEVVVRVEFEDGRPLVYRLSPSVAHTTGLDLSDALEPLATEAAPLLMRDVPGGLASLNELGKIRSEQLPEVIGEQGPPGPPGADSTVPGPPGPQGDDHVHIGPDAPESLAAPYIWFKTYSNGDVAILLEDGNGTA